MSRRLFASVVISSLALAGGALCLPSRLLAAPEPNSIPQSWQLDIRHGPLERIMVTVEGKEKAFWFMRYTVINNSGKDILFTPSFQLLAETGTVSEAFTDVPQTVFPKIKDLYPKTMLESPTNIYGKLLQGEDNAKDGVAIFPSIDPDARNFKLFITGFSGETATVEAPFEKKPVILQKTMELDFNIPGEEIGIEPHAQLR